MLQDQNLSSFHAKIKETAAAIRAARAQAGGIAAGATTFVSGGRIESADGRVLHYETLTGVATNAADTANVLFARQRIAASGGVSGVRLWGPEEPAAMGRIGGEQVDKYERELGAASVPSDGGTRLVPTITAWSASWISMQQVQAAHEVGRACEIVDASRPEAPVTFTYPGKLPRYR